MKLAPNQFAIDNHTPSKGSHYGGSWDSLVELVLAHWDNQKPGFTDGCVEVTVPAEGFLTGVVTLKDVIKALAPVVDLRTEFGSRRKGEEPVLYTRAPAKFKSPAKSVRIICYSHDLLNQDGDCTTNAEFEIITILAEAGTEPAPMPPVTMARNFLNLEGGTKGDFSPEDFAKSIMYWSQHVIAEDL